MRKKIGATAFMLEGSMLCAISFLLAYPHDYALRIGMLYVVVQCLFGHYKSETLLIWEEIALLVKSHICFFVISFLLYPVKELNIPYGWMNLLVSVFMLCFSIVIQRYLRIFFRNSCADKVLIVGTGDQAVDLAKVCGANRFALMQVQGFIQIDDRKTCKQEDVAVFSLQDMEQVIQRMQIDSAVIVSSEVTNRQFEKIISRLRSVRKIRYIPWTRILTFDSKIEDFDGRLLISTAKGNISKVNKVFKRMIDILGAFAGVVLLVPLTCYVWTVNRKNGDQGPIFFKQMRIGKDGTLFSMYKYRTMIPNAEQKLQQLMEEDAAIREEYQKNKKLRHDPRITKAGAFLRQKSLDEFPQFLNVLKGDMSLIGPRPYLPNEKQDMGLYYEYVIGCKPGITGMWQTHGRSDISFLDRLKMDEYYYRNWSLKLDMTILVKTIKTVFKGDGAI